MNNVSGCTTKEDGSSLCDCSEGWSGSYCQCPTNEETMKELGTKLNNASLTDKNGKTCNEYARCENTNSGSFVCTFCDQLTNETCNAWTGFKLNRGHIINEAIIDTTMGSDYVENQKKKQCCSGQAYCKRSIGFSDETRKYQCTDKCAGKKTALDCWDQEFYPYMWGGTPTPAWLAYGNDHSFMRSKLGPNAYKCCDWCGDYGYENKNPLYRNGCFTGGEDNPWEDRPN